MNFCKLAPLCLGDIKIEPRLKTGKYRNSKI